MIRLKANQKVQKENEFECFHCKKQFTSEKRELEHMCVKKERFQAREDRHVQIGFYAFKTFWKKKQDPKKRTFY